MGAAVGLAKGIGDLFSENFDRFMGSVLSSRTVEAAIELSFQPAVVFGEAVTPS